MFGSKKRAYRDETVKAMFLISPTVTGKELEKFKDTFQAHIDQFYSSGRRPEEAAMGIAFSFTKKILEKTSSGDFKEMSEVEDFKPWLVSILDAMRNSKALSQGSGLQQKAMIDDIFDKLSSLPVSEPNPNNPNPINYADLVKNTRAGRETIKAATSKI